MNTRLTRNTICILFFGFSSFIGKANHVYFVKSGSKGNGLSWSSAFGDLQKALHRAQSGDEIHVAGGTYLPTTKRDRNESFHIPSGIKLLGGYEGTELNSNTRDWKLYPSILSGNIGTNDATDNSYHVLTIKGATDQTMIEGFIIEGGYADAERSGNFETKCIGGGLLNYGWKGKPSVPNFAHCTFKNNFAKDGGAVYNIGRAGNASPTFTDCQFVSNEVHMDGGAVYNDAGQQGIAKPAFVNCTFSKNKGNYGGAVFNYGVNGDTESSMEACSFVDNAAYTRGGAIYNVSTNPVNTDFQKSTFVDNQAYHSSTDNVYNLVLINKSVLR
jgi:hypothetical protein